MCPFDKAIYTPAPTIMRWIRKLEIRVRSWITAFDLRYGFDHQLQVEQWLHLTLEEANGTWKAEDFPRLVELRIVVDYVACMVDRERWKEVWERLPRYTSIDLQPERVEVVLEMNKYMGGECHCKKPGWCRRTALDMCGIYLWAWCERGRREISFTALRYQKLYYGFNFAQNSAAPAYFAIYQIQRVAKR
jgi:hypothetical protein